MAGNDHVDMSTSGADRTAERLAAVPGIRRAPTPKLQQFMLSEFLDAYLSYYRRVLPLVDRIVLADFTEVISDFGAVIERCNEKFGTSFVRYVKTDEDEKAIAAKIDEIMAATTPEDQIESKAPRPSAQRRLDRASIRMPGK